MKLLLALSMFLIGCGDKPIRFAHLERRETFNALIEYADESWRQAYVDEIFQSTVAWHLRKNKGALFRWLKPSRH